MALIHTLLLVLHVVTAAAWFGLALRLGGQARQVADLEGEAALALARDGTSGLRLMAVFLLLTFAFSMGMLGLGGGYPGQVQYHIASLLIVVLIVVHYLVIRPAWQGLLRSAVSGADKQGFRKRVAMGAGAGHLIWIALVVLMFWNRFANAL